MVKSMAAEAQAVNEFIHDGNVDVRTGNIQFDGDVRIGQDVETSMSVGATGKVFIQGTVQKATVEAGTSAIIEGNVLSSTVEVGMQEVLEEVLAAQLSGLLTYLEKLNDAIHETLRIRGIHLADIDASELKDLVRVTLKETYLDFQHDKFEFIQKAKNHSTQLSEEWMTIVEKLHNIFTDTSLTVVKNAEEFSQLMKEAKTIVESYSRKEGGGSRLKLPYAINSVLSCNGSIEVTGSGLYNCSVTAKESISIEGCCRGGIIVAGGKVSIKETGSTKGVKTVVKTESGGTITIGLARCGTEIWIGDEVYHIDADQIGIHARLKEGHLQVL